MELKNTAGYGIIALYLPVAQLDSARDSDSRGRRFESCRVGQKEKHFVKGACHKAGFTCCAKTIS